MHIVKIGLAFAVVGTLIIGASVQLSFAQAAGLKLISFALKPSTHAARRQRNIPTTFGVTWKCSSIAAVWQDIASRSDPEVLRQQQGRRELMASFEECQRLCRLRSIAQLESLIPGKTVPQA